MHIRKEADSAGKGHRDITAILAAGLPGRIGRGARLLLFDEAGLVANLDKVAVIQLFQRLQLLIELQQPDWLSLAVKAGIQSGITLSKNSFTFLLFTGETEKLDIHRTGSLLCFYNGVGLILITGDLNHVPPGQEEEDHRDIIAPYRSRHQLGCFCLSGAVHCHSRDSSTCQNQG